MGLMRLKTMYALCSALNRVAINALMLTALMLMLKYFFCQYDASNDLTLCNMAIAWHTQLFLPTTSIIVIMSVLHNGYQSSEL